MGARATYSDYRTKKIKFQQKLNMTNKVVFIFDANFIKPLIGVISSIDHNDENKDYEFYLTFLGNKEQEKYVFTLCSKAFQKYKFHIKNIVLNFPEIDRICNKLYDINSAGTQLKTPLLYCRGYLTEIWPEVDDIMLHLDLDIIVNKPLSSLFTIIRNNRGFVCYACPNQPNYVNFNNLGTIPDIIDGHPEVFSKYAALSIEKIKKIKVNTSPSFNAGVFALNFKECRKINFSALFEVCMHINAIKKVFNHNDQSILNYLFYNNYYELDLNWNYLVGKARIVANANYKQYNYDHAIKNAYLMHFNGPIKQWHINDNVISELWKKYL